MFFLCATVLALVIFWATRPSEGASTFDEARIPFLPALLCYHAGIADPVLCTDHLAFFHNRKFNYAESLVLFSYTVAFSLLLVIIPNLINLLPHHFKTEYVEIPLLAIYVVWTNLNFFNDQPVWIVISKSIISLLACWFSAYFITDFIIHQMM